MQVPSPHRRRGGFTLIEVLIVVVILGILAATVLPQFTVASDEAKETALTQSLQTIRSQIQLYRFQHEGQLPGTVTGVDLNDALTQKTDAAGALSATGEYGPYITGQLPPNPLNGLRTVKVVSGDSLAASDVDGTTGWLYADGSGEFRANFDGNMSNGTTVFSQ